MVRPIGGACSITGPTLVECSIRRVVHHTRRAQGRNGRPYYAGVYPAQELLQEVGRVTIAGARLEVQMGALWWQLDRGSVDEITARKDSISMQVANVRRLAGIRLGPTTMRTTSTCTPTRPTARAMR